MANQPAYSDPIKLAQPVVRGSGDKKQKIEEVKIRLPNAGELRGTRLSLLQLEDVDSMMTVLPRITEPALNEADLVTMHPGDFAKLSGEVADFLDLRPMS